ncbi:hypothetical protein Bca52824_072873 [Brassica carinata]|uniref:PCI domain-containing protein n=1 Tax=Brassica carinata TaxID=52824 RepID=A0A8X7QE98_BRACI|nr:hypothetical protein Bca52824_072873 [Brassica carinata]
MVSFPATTETISLALEANSSEAIQILDQVLEDPSSSPEDLRIKEQAITNLCERLTKEKRGEDLRTLLTKLRTFFSLIPKAKTAKIITLCKEMVHEWTRAEKRTFLRQRVEARLAALLMENKEYVEALALLSTLVKEVSRLDDQSKLHFSLRNLPKVKAALTTARTAANAIYYPPAQQRTINFQSGILNAEEKYCKTGYNYFFEGFESFNALGISRAVLSFKYMLFCKIMVSQADDVVGIISSMAGHQYVGPDLDAIKANALYDYKAEQEDDPVIHRHLSSLYDTLLEQNLCRLIEPFSRVEIAHIAELIELPIDHVEKLSQMILDKNFAGTLDQGAGYLIIFEDPKADTIYSATLDTTANMEKVVDSPYIRSAKIMA